MLRDDLTDIAEGKACFLCENEHASRNLVISHECTTCIPPAALPKQAPRVLEHMAVHILFDPSIDRSAEPCGLCLHPSPLCVYHLKKGKGAGASEQVDFTRTTCAKSYHSHMLLPPPRPLLVHHQMYQYIAPFARQQLLAYGNTTSPTTFNRNTQPSR
jgi:hypothetical protein